MANTNHEWIGNFLASGCIRFLQPDSSASVIFIQNLLAFSEMLRSWVSYPSPKTLQKVGAVETHLLERTPLDSRRALLPRPSLFGLINCMGSRVRSRGGHLLL